MLLRVPRSTIYPKSPVRQSRNSEGAAWCFVPKNGGLPKNGGRTQNFPHHNRGLRRHALPVVVVFWIAGLLISTSARADDIELPQIKVEAKKPPLLDSVAPATVVEVDEEETAGKTVADFVEEVPGVQVVRQGSTGKRESITIRGSDSQQVLVLIEGLGSVASPQGGGADLSLVPLEDRKSVV